MKLQRDLRGFVELLNSRKVDFVVVGAHALAFHGHPPLTGDSVSAQLDGLPARFLGRATLLRNKKAAGRLKDLADVEALEKRPPRER